MDLETVEKKISSHKYHSRTEFLSDIQLISHNCEKFNGVESTFTKQAKVLVDFTKKALEEVFSLKLHLAFNKQLNFYHLVRYCSLGVQHIHGPRTSP